MGKLGKLTRMEISMECVRSEGEDDAFVIVDWIALGESSLNPFEDTLFS